MGKFKIWKILLFVAVVLLGACETKAVADVDALYNTYLCNVGINAGIGSPEDTYRPDSINVHWENVGFTGDLSYTEYDAVVECEVAYSDSTLGGPEVTDSDGNPVTKPLYCECEKSN